MLKLQVWSVTLQENPDVAILHGFGSTSLLGRWLVLMAKAIWSFALLPMSLLKVAMGPTFLHPLMLIHVDPCKASLFCLNTFAACMQEIPETVIRPTMWQNLALVWQGFAMQMVEKARPAHIWVRTSHMNCRMHLCAFIVYAEKNHSFKVV